MVSSHRENEFLGNLATSWDLLWTCISSSTYSNQ